MDFSPFCFPLTPTPSHPSALLDFPPFFLIPVFPLSQPADPCPWWGAGLVLTLAKGSLCPHPLPWWSRPPLHPPHRVSPPESWGMQGGVLGGCWPPPGLLLPCTAGPCIRLWHRCYLRGLPQEQVVGKLRHGGRLGPGGSWFGGVPVWRVPACLAAWAGGEAGLSLCPSN